MRKTLINADGLCVNVVEVGDNWPLPEGQTFGDDGGEIGWTWNGAAWDKPYVAPDPVPPVTAVSPYQARMALLNAGLLDAVDALMADENTPRAAKLAWEYGTVVERQSAFIESLAPALNLTDEQIDALFVAAGAV